MVRFKTRTRKSLLIAITALFGLGSAAGLTPALAGATGSGPYGAGSYGSGHGSPATVYDNIPDPAPGNVPSVGFEATSASEFGGQVGLDGSQRKDPKITVLMSSWACKSGTWQDKNCITNPGSTFTHPVTLNVYKVNSDDSVGDKIASETRTFTMPYRPTADDGTNCKDANGNPTGAWYDGDTCNNGKAFLISFKLDNVTLPDDVIISVAYNTTHHGYAPIGETACDSTPQGCPYDALNVGTNPTPSVGEAEPTADDAYYNTSVAGFYCDGGTAGSGTFRLDEGCWTGFLPAIRVQAEGGGQGHHHSHHHRHHHKHHGHNRGWDKDRHHKHKAFNYLERH